MPAIVSEETFALAAERLADNKRFAPRRTIEPSIVQGLVILPQMRLCAVAVVDPQFGAQNPLLPLPRLDAWRHLGGAVRRSCRPIRQDLLDGDRVAGSYSPD